MFGLIVTSVIVMAIGFVATVVIGQSKSNKEENPSYFHYTEKKWLRLGGIYVVSIVLVVIVMVVILSR